MFGVIKLDVRDKVVEEFGKDVMITKNEDGSFNASFLTATEGLVYWALQYLDSVEVVSPASVRNEVIKLVKANKYNA